MSKNNSTTPQNERPRTWWQRWLENRAAEKAGFKRRESGGMVFYEVPKREDKDRE